MEKRARLTIDILHPSGVYIKECLCKIVEEIPFNTLAQVYIYVGKEGDIKE